MKIILTISFWAITLIATAQKPFNYLYDFGFVQAGAFLISECDNGYALIGQAYIDDERGREVYLSKHKYNGENTLVTTWRNNKVGSALFGFGENNIIKGRTENELIFSFISPSLGNCFTLFHEETIDTISCVRIVEGEYQYVMNQQLLIDDYFVGLLNTPKNEISIVIKHINSLPEEFQVINLTPDEHKFTNCHIIFDESKNEFLIFGAYSPDPNSDIYGLFFMRVSDNFKIIDIEYILGRYLISDGLIIDSDKNYVFTGLAYKPVNELGVSFHSKPTLFKISSDLEMIWEYRTNIPFSNRADRYRGIVETNDKDGYIVSGNTVDLNISFDNIVTLTKFNKAGDSLWQKKVYSLADDNNLRAEGLIKDKYGHNVIGGSNSARVDNDTLSSYLQQWLFKFDDNGDVIYDMSTNVLETLTSDIKIYPNPTADVVFIDQKTEQKVIYELYDFSGRLIDSKPSKGNGIIMMDTYQYVSGNYLLKAVDAKGQTIHAQKIVVQ